MYEKKPEENQKEKNVIPGRSYLQAVAPKYYELDGINGMITC